MIKEFEAKARALMTDPNMSMAHSFTPPSVRKENDEFLRRGEAIEEDLRRYGYGSTSTIKCKK